MQRPALTSRTFAAWLLAFGLAATFCVRTGVYEAAAQPSEQTPEAFEGVALDQNLGAELPLDLPFVDAAGQAVELGAYFQGERPVVMALVYHSCPMLCHFVLDGAFEGFKQLEWTPGSEYEVVVVSFAEGEGPELAARVKERYVGAMERPEAAAGLHFLTGDASSIDALAEAVGFQFKWVEEQQEYAHPATLIFMSPGGVVTRYLPGITFEPQTLRTALVESGDGTVGSLSDAFVMFCFQYSPDENAYVLHAANLMKLAGGATVLALGLGLLVFWRREKRAQDARSGSMPYLAS